MDILESKAIILNEVNKLFEFYQTVTDECNKKEKEWMKEKNIITEANGRLIKEVAEKDKLLFVNEKKFLDYEIMINKIQDEALKEVDEKTKHDMLRAQDKEIHDRDMEIKRLQKKLDSFEKDKEEKVDDHWKRYEKNSFYNEDEKVDVAIEAYRQHLGTEVVSIDDVGKTSLGINGWFQEGMKNKPKDKKLVDKMKDITSKQVNNETKEEDPNMIYEDDTVQEVVKEVVEDEKAEDEKVEEKVEDEKVEEKVEDEKEVSEEESDSEDEMIVSIIKYYGKEYYIVEGESPQYIYAIENGELGEKKGELKNGKKVMYK